MAWWRKTEHFAAAAASQFEIPTSPIQTHHDDILSISCFFPHCVVPFSAKVSPTQRLCIYFCVKRTTNVRTDCVRPKYSPIFLDERARMCACVRVCVGFYLLYFIYEFGCFRPCRHFVAVRTEHCTRICFCVALVHINIYNNRAPFFLRSLRMRNQLPFTSFLVETNFLTFSVEPNRPLKFFFSLVTVVPCLSKPWRTICLRFELSIRFYLAFGNCDDVAQLVLICWIGSEVFLFPNFLFIVFLFIFQPLRFVTMRFRCGCVIRNAY